MTPDVVVDLVTEMLWLASFLALPILGAGLTVGLVISVFQAATQIQENAIAFVPKLMAVGTTLILMAPWMIERITLFTTVLFEEISRMGPNGVG